MARLEVNMVAVLAGWSGKPHVDALMALRGFQTVAAMTVVSELGDLSRFKSPRQLDEQDQAGDEVVDDVLETEADSDAERAGEKGEFREIDSRRTERQEESP